jgi:hypothetical protein
MVLKKGSCTMVSMTSNMSTGVARRRRGAAAAESKEAEAAAAAATSRSIAAARPAKRGGVRGLLAAQRQRVENGGSGGGAHGDADAAPLRAGDSGMRSLAGWFAGCGLRCAVGACACGQQGAGR